MFGQCALRTTLSKLTSELRLLFTFSKPFLGPFFLFLPNLSRPPYPSCVNGLVFSHPGLPLPLDSSTTASHGSNRAGLGLCWCRSPTWFSKPHTGSHRAEFGFTAAFSQPFSVRAPQADAPGGNLPPHEWAGSCKAASRFSRFRLMSTR